MIYSKDQIQYGTTTIPYHVVKSKRIKTSEIIVDSDKVTIRTPLNKNLSDIKRLVSGKASWTWLSDFEQQTVQLWRHSWDW
jgi:predicted metal-dependent hydrolase